MPKNISNLGIFGVYAGVDVKWIRLTPTPKQATTFSGGKDADQRLFEHLVNLAAQGHSIAVSGVLHHNEKESPLLNQLLELNWKRHDLVHDYNVVSKTGKKDTQEVLLTNYTPKLRQ